MDLQIGLSNQGETVDWGCLRKLSLGPFQYLKKKKARC